MSVVYKVRHNTLGSLHALKVLTLSSPGLRQRLLLEGQVQASLRHPNIVPVTDVIDVNGVPGLVMEFVDGPDLDAMLRAHPLTFDQIDALARDIIGAVAAAHTKNLIHRDLKPANILLMVVDDRLVPKITDFGLAKVLVGPTGEKAHTRTGAMMGTPYYMAPEQVRDAKHVGPQADVFSLGAILYEMITRQRAFQGEDLYEVFSAVATGRYTPVRELAPDLPARMEKAIEAALRVDLAARCRDCRELLALWNGERVDVVGASLWTGEQLRSAHALSSAARSGPEVPTPSASTFDPGPKAPTPSPRSHSGVTVPPRGALAIGVLVGGGAAVVGLGLLVLVVGVAWAGWSWSTSPPADAPVAVVDPVPTEVTDPVVEVPAPAPVPVVAPVQPGERPPAPVVTPTPVPSSPSASPVPQPTPVPDPVPDAVPGQLPSDLDPETTKSGRREETLLGVYKSQPSATAIIVQVMKTDPSPDVRTIAGSVLRSRWKDGMDPAAHQTAVTWCARSGNPVALRAQCLRTLGELGDGRAGAVLAASIDDPATDVRDAASLGCRKWSERFPGQSGEVSCGTAGRTVKEQLDRLRNGE